MGIISQLNPFLVINNILSGVNMLQIIVLHTTFQVFDKVSIVCLIDTLKTLTNKKVSRVVGSLSRKLFIFVILCLNNDDPYRLI